MNYDIVARLGRSHPSLPTEATDNGVVPLVCFDGPCMFRDIMTDTLVARASVPWRLSLTSPSLAAVCGAGLRAGLGVTVRTPLGISAGDRYPWRGRTFRS